MITHALPLMYAPQTGRAIALMPNAIARRRLATFQSAQVADLTVYFGKTFPTPLPRDGSAPRPAPSVVIRDPAAIRRWKLAMANSMYDMTYGPAYPGSGPRWDSVTFELKGGRRIAFLLYGPYDVAENWGYDVQRLYRAAVDVAKWGPSGRPRP